MPLKFDDESLSLVKKYERLYPIYDRMLDAVSKRRNKTFAGQTPKQIHCYFCGDLIVHEIKGRYLVFGSAIKTHSGCAQEAVEFIKKHKPMMDGKVL